MEYGNLFYEMLETNKKILKMLQAMIYNDAWIIRTRMERQGKKTWMNWWLFFQHEFSVSQFFQKHRPFLGYGCIRNEHCHLRRLFLIKSTYDKQNERSWITVVKYEYNAFLFRCKIELSKVFIVLPVQNLSDSLRSC